MISLLRAEIRRYSARRLMRIMAIVFIGLLVLTLGRIAQVSHRDTDAARQRQVEQFEEMTRDAREQCERDKASGLAPSQVDCDVMMGEPYYEDPRLHARSALGAGVRAVAVAVALFAFVAAASFVGGDWSHGTMQALLFWEPRRPRVLLAKAVASAAVPIAFMVVAQALTYAALWLTGATRGTTEGVTAGLHMSNLLTLGRCAVVVAIASLLGYGFAGLARYTVAAVVVGFAYFAVVEMIVRNLRPGWQRFLLAENITAIMNKKVEVAPASGRMAFDFFDELPMYTLTAARGALTLGIYLAILLGAFYLVFTRRDVT